MLGAFQIPRIQLQFTEFKSPISSSTSGNRDDFLPRRTLNNSTHSHLSLSKPSFLVRTESNVQKEKRRKPDPFCVVCKGSGRVDCHHCHGLGRTNCTDLVMLPKGEWPKWCKTCGGSGLGYCTRCLGTGEYRDIMGFHFMKMEDNQTRNHITRQVEENIEHATSTDVCLSQISS